MKINVKTQFRLGLCAETLIAKAFRFAARAFVEGGYMDFGAYHGASPIEASRFKVQAIKCSVRQIDVLGA